ncbi:DUF4251 domain-containing protein [Chitinophaga qingshengii]|uniref:DUF4251 domain-containing protein n=1 Tax=Chitinophaga qingshengii TaxID=1569794 RepID=A0ABR7TX74_9BACT|nr:DUF4251 domain-containing protein [Chitinophaga qingshengii]MBC9934285.1 DUF4251 domain-containing protein [Chitinophaga qingshengii]
MKHSFAGKTLFFLSLSLFLFTGAYAQQTKVQEKAAKEAAKTAAVKAMVDSKTFVFIAQSALPMSGRVRQITPDFNLVVTPDSVVSYLPYFGRAYSAPYGSTKSPLDFKTKDFQYTSSPRKKDGWDINIKPKDQDIQNMAVTITSSGYATVQVTSNNRQPITFNGYIQEVKK